MNISSQARALVVLTSLSALFALPQAQAANKTWTGGGADNNWGTAANWSPGAVATNDNLIFSGGTQLNNDNNIVNLTNGWVQFNPSGGGFTLNGNTWFLNSTVSGAITNSAGVNILALPVSFVANNETWNIASGSELRFAGPVTNNSGANPLGLVVGGGTVRLAGNVQSTRWFTINNGAVIVDGANVNVSNDGFRLQPLASGQTAAFSVINNATVKLVGAGSVRLAQSGSAAGGIVSVNINSGSFEYDPTASGSSPAYTGNISLGETAGVTTTVTQNGGLVWLNPVLYGSSDIKTLNVLYNAGGGTYNLNGGMLMVRSVTNALASVSSAVFNFNGGVLTPAAAPLNGTAFFPNTLSANVQSGGAIISNSTAISPITIVQNLAAGSPSGGLVKLGNGTVNLNGANTYTGGTVVGSGVLAVTTTSTGAGAYSVADGAELDVQVAASGATLNSSSLTLGSSGTGALTQGFVLGANASTTTPASTVSGTLILNGTVTVNVSGTVSTGNTYLLMSYGSLIGSGGFVAGSLPTVVGYVGIVTNNPSLKQLQLYYTQAPQPVKWAVGSGNWDTTSPDWTILGGGGLTNYVEGSPVLFDDSASGSSPITITLVGNRSPGGITNAASAKTYMLTGSPNILSGSVVVNGGGTLVVDNGSGNNFSAVAISSGALQLGNGDTGGSLGNGAITDNGTLVLDRTDNLNLGNAISGTGGLTQNGSDAVTITAANTFAGGTAINAGDVVMGNASALSTNTITIGSGATLDLDGNGATLSGLQSIVAAGAGLGGIGAIYSSGAGNNNAFRNVTLTGDMTIGGPATAIIGLRTTANSDPGLIAHGYNLTKMGGCQVNFNGGTTVAGITNTWFQDIGNIDIQGGVLSFERHAALGNPTNTITVESGATLQLFSLTPTNPVPTNGIVLNNGMLQSTGGTAGDTNTLGGQITLNGLANSINAVSGFYLAVEGPIVGSGGVVYAGAVSLSGANTYTGNTIISSGTLSLIGAGTVANSSTISVGIGATLDASGLAGEFALGAGQTLSNSASATGNLNAGAGGINTGSGQVSVSYLSNTPPLNIVGGTLNLSAATVVAVNNTGAPLVPGTYDIISSSGSGAVGGTAPVSVSVANGPSAGTPTLSIAGGELYLTVGGTSSISYTGTGPFTYNGLAQGPAAIFTGSTGAQSTLYVGVSVSHGPSAAAPVAAGTYYETNTVAPDANYFGAANSQTFTINPAPLFGQSQIAATTAGTVTLNFAGTPGYSYTVQRSTNLLDAWTAIWTTNAPTGGDFEFIDDPAPQPAAYYRLQYNP